MNDTPSTILARLVRRFGLLVLLTVLGAGAGGIYGAVKTPAFRAQANVVFTAERGESVAAVSFAQAYGRIVTDGPVAEAAATALGSRAGMANVTAATSPDAPVVEITAVGPDAGRTADVANALAKALVDYATSRKTATRVSASLLTRATTPTVPSSPKPPLELAVGAAAGLLVGGLAALAGVGRIRRDDTATAMARDTSREPVWAATSVATAVTMPTAQGRAAGAANTADPAPTAIAWRPVPMWVAAEPPNEPDRHHVAVPRQPVAMPVGMPVGQPFEQSIAQPVAQPRVVGRAVVITREPQ